MFRYGKLFQAICFTWVGYWSAWFEWERRRVIYLNEISQLAECALDNKTGLNTRIGNSVHISEKPLMKINF